METVSGSTPPKKWKNIIFVNELMPTDAQVHQSIEEMNVREAIAALTTALDEALHEAKMLPSKRTRRR
jgi:hypothetical protein